MQSPVRVRFFAPALLREALHSVLACRPEVELVDSDPVVVLLHLTGDALDASAGPFPPIEAAAARLSSAGDRS